MTRRGKKPKNICQAETFTNAFFSFSLLNWRFIVTRRHYNKKYKIYGFDSFMGNVTMQDGQLVRP